MDMTQHDAYVVGLDFGSDSVRALVVNTQNGEEISSGVSYYPRWQQHLYCDATHTQFRHHPLDYIESMTDAVRTALSQLADPIVAQIVGIGVDTTGSTPAPIDADGQILALRPEFSENPNAMFVLWKDHTSIKMAERINTLAHSGDYPDYTNFIGGIYSAEWFWAKAAHVSEVDSSVAQSAYSWVELADWIPALLSNNTAPQKLKHGICAAGHKALWHESWGGLPAQDFLSAISSTFDGIRERMFDCVYTAEQKAGDLSPEWAEKLGLPPGIAIAIGAFDCHMGAVGAGAGAADLVKVMGTSTCDILMVPETDIKDKTIKGICGQVKGSARPDMIALEAGQSGFGDIYAWFKQVLLWPLAHLAKTDSNAQQQLDMLSDWLIPQLSEAAQSYSPDLHSPLAIDWHSGRRTPYANQRVTGAISQLNLGSDAPAMFHALVESTAHGAKAIMDCMTEQGTRVERVIAIGGISKKSPFVMQLCADVMGQPIAVVESEQCCALGAAIFAAVAANIYTDSANAQQAMASKICKHYQPDQQRHQFYLQRHQQYQSLGKFIEHHSTQE
ncbi:ribulokinase [Celerinatantimonas yamalensis]|uniref:Ribulokinase n=1 Tax=Celerinatantimonas yamalensis TaxID=559956 RepID=A0ABW9GAM3_9GAMM